MSIEVTIRHQEAAKGLKEYAEKRAAKLVEKFPKVESVRIVIDSQRHLYEAQVLAQEKGQTAVGGNEHAVNVRSAIDTAVARAEKQLRDSRKKVISVHTRVASAK